MRLVKFDITRVEGYPFKASAEAKEEYGSDREHPILDRYFDASAPVRYFYWKKLEMLCDLDEYDGGGTALAAGCGPGVELPTLATGFRKVIALDLNGDDLEIARAICRAENLANVEIVEADLLDPGEGQDGADTVFLIDVLEHFPDPAPAVESVYRLLPEGGKLVMVAPTENRLNDWLRRALGYSKPATHYHDSRALEQAARRRFRLARKVRPFGLPRALSLSEIFLFVK
ncbi:MAG: class I SAM-dependent methyltransferase [Thermoleophilia bacterium]|nr:class I SAM-dependent methyltransferase [Thermoleophilia bacterium]